MGRGKHCCVERRKQIVSLRDQNWSIRKIAAFLNVSRNQVNNAIQYFKKYDTCENVFSRKRPRKTTKRMDRKIVRMLKTNPLQTAMDIKKKLCNNEGLDISVSTIKRRLHDFGLHGRVARRKPLISKKNRKLRVKFAKDHLHWTVHQWKHILFSDESKFNRIGSDGKQYVWRKKREEFNPKYTMKTVKGGGGSVMVWGCMSWYGVGPIHHIIGIMDQHCYVNILNDVMLPFAEENLSILWTFQQDNDPKHTSKIAKKWFEDNLVDVLEWPSCSPDLNPIENLWQDVKLALRGKFFKNLPELFEGISQEWRNIKSEKCQRLIESMPRRCAAVIKAKGHPTKY